MVPSARVADDTLYMSVTSATANPEAPVREPYEFEVGPGPGLVGQPLALAAATYQRTAAVIQPGQYDGLHAMSHPAGVH